MNASKTIGLLLVAVSLIIGCLGVRTMTLTPEPIESPNYETYAADELGKMRGLLYLGFCLILLEGGIFAFRGQKIQGEKL